MKMKKIGLFVYSFVLAFVNCFAQNQVETIGDTSVFGDVHATNLIYLATDADKAFVSWAKDSESNFTSSVTIGTRTGDIGEYSITIGEENEATGWNSYAQGMNARAFGDNSHAEGISVAVGDNSHAENSSGAFGDNSHSEGESAAYGKASHSEGFSTLAIGDKSHSEGENTIAYGQVSHAEGNAIYQMLFGVMFSTPAGEDENSTNLIFEITNSEIKTPNMSVGDYLLFGLKYDDEDVYSQNVEVIIRKIIDIKDNVVTIDRPLGYILEKPGSSTIRILRGSSLGSASHSEGLGNNAFGQAAHAEGTMTTAEGISSHSEGWLTKANGFASHSAGISAKANDDLSYVWNGEQFNSIKEYEFTISDGLTTNFYEYGVPIDLTLNGLLGTSSDWNGWSLYMIKNSEHSYYETQFTFKNGSWDTNVMDESFFIYDMTFKKDEAEPVTFTTILGKPYYESHGNGTFNVNPEGGLDGFYVGESNLQNHIESMIDSELTKIKQAIDYDTEVGTIQYEERNGELWVTEGSSDHGIIKIPAYKDGKKVRGIKYNAIFDAEEFYFLGTDLEVLKHETNINGQVVLDYYEYPNWQDLAMRIYMPNVKEIPPWYFMSLPRITDFHNIYYFYGPNVERIGDYAFANTNLGEDEGYGYTSIDFPSLKFVGANAFMNTPATDVRVPELLEMDASTFGSEVTNLYAPKVRIVRGITSGTSTNNPNFRLPFQTNSCFKNIKHVYLPSCEEIGNNVFHFEDAIDTLDKPKSVYLPKCKRVGDNNWFFNVSYLYMPECVDWNGRFEKSDINDTAKPGAKHRQQSDFVPNTNLTSVVLGTKTLNNNAFRKCIALTNAEFPNLETGANWAFAGCTNLQHVDMPKLIHGANYMFYNCNNLNYGNFPELLDVGKKMFSGCSKIERVISSKDSNKLKNDQSFDYDNGFVLMPKVQYIGTEAFSAYDPSDYTPPEEGEDEGEWKVSGNLRAIELPIVKEIGPSAFRGQRKLSTLEIPTCEVIGDAAFYRAGSYVENDIDDEIDKLWHPLGRNGKFNLPNVRKIGSTAFAHARFGYVSNKDGIYRWLGITVNAPNATYIAPDAFYDTWKILDIYAPLWAHTNTLFTLKEQYNWGHRSQTGEHSLTNIVWLGYEHEKDYLGERVNLWQKMGTGENDGEFHRRYDTNDPYLPEAFGSTWIFDSDAPNHSKTAYTIGPFTNNANDTLTLSFKAIPTCSYRANTNYPDIWTIEKAYENDGGIVTVKIFEDGVNTKTETFNLRKNPLSDSPWIKFSLHDRGEGSQKDPWWGYDIINEPKEILVKTTSSLDNTEIKFEITSDLFMPCYSDIEVRRNGLQNDISSLLRRVQILEDHVTDIETGGPLYRSYVAPRNIKTSNIVQYIQSGNLENFNGINFVPISKEECNMIDTSDIEWEIVDPFQNRENDVEAITDSDGQTSLIKKKVLDFECSGDFETNEVPSFVSTDTMFYTTNCVNVYSDNKTNPPGFYWKVAGESRGTWAYKYKNFSNEIPIKKEYKPGSTIQSYWGFIGIVSNSLRDKINTGLQALWEIPGKFKGPFNDYNSLGTSNATWNVNFWAYPVDMTCVSPCFTRTNNISSASWTTQHTAITRRHVIGAWHWHMYPGEGYLHFYDRDNNIYFRNVIKQQRIEDTDLVLMMLDEDLPESITPASIINTNDYSKFLTIVTNGWGLLTPKGERGLKCECVHFRHYIARSMWFDIENIDNDDENIIAYTNNSNPYVTGSWYEKSTMIGGDSSSPILLYINGKTVVVEIVHYANGSGANVSRYANLLEKQIQEWAGTTETNLYWLDLNDLDLTNNE